LEKRSAAARPAYQGSFLNALQASYPILGETIRDHATQ
jgi:hypothetical protein